MSIRAPAENNNNQNNNGNCTNFVARVNAVKPGCIVDSERQKTFCHAEFISAEQNPQNQEELLVKYRLDKEDYSNSPQRLLCGLKNDVKSTSGACDLSWYNDAVAKCSNCATKITNGQKQDFCNYKFKEVLSGDEDHQNIAAFFVVNAKGEAGNITVDNCVCDNSGKQNSKNPGSEKEQSEKASDKPKVENTECKQEVKTLEAKVKEVTKGQALLPAEKMALSNLNKLTDQNCENVKTGLQNAIKKYENIAKEQSEKANQEKEKWDKMKKNPSLTCCYVETWMVRDYGIPTRGGGRCACVQDYKTVDASNPKTLIDGWGKDNGVKNFVCDDRDHNTRAGIYGQSARQCYSPDTDKFYEFLFKK